jgi:hypothetical protein
MILNHNFIIALYRIIKVINISIQLTITASLIIITAILTTTIFKTIQIIQII